MHFSSKLAKKSKKWRGALIYLALFGVAPMAFGAETRYVSDYASLRAAISEYNGNTGSDFNIVLTRNITLADNLPEITGNQKLTGINNGSLKIDGAGYAIDGAGKFRGLYVDSSEANATVTVANVTFADCYAKGGNGGDGAAAGGGGMGAGAAIYAYSGSLVLNNVTAAGSAAVGGNGGSVLYGSESYGAGGGLGGDGGNGKLLETGAAAGGGVYANGADSSTDKQAGDGGVVSNKNLDSYAHVKPGTTTPVGGNSLAGGGGGASVAYGGNGGFGGGAGAGATLGGEGGFGGGGAGSSSDLTAGDGGFAGGHGGYIDPVESTIFASTPGGGTGGGGAALGGAIFVGSEANVTVVVDKDKLGEIYGGSVVAGQGGGGTAENGEAIGKGLFLLNDLNINVAEGGKYVISDNIGGYAGSSKVSADANGKYENTSGIVKSGEGELVLNAGGSTYTGDTTVKGGSLVAKTTGAISSYSGLNVDAGTVELQADQSVRNLNGGSLGVVDLKSNTLTVTGDENDGAYAGKIKGDGTLVKQGTNALALAGDSRGEKFNTVLNGGTIRVQNDGAFGDGTLYYTRSDANDQTTSLEFSNGINMANDIVLNGNDNALILGGGSATLSGTITKKPGSNGEVIIRVANGESIHLANTGVSTDEEGKIVVSNGNDISKLTIENGGLLVDVDSFMVDDTRYWYNSLGGADIVSDGDTKLSMILNTDDPDAGLLFGNNTIAQSGWLTVDPVTLKDHTDQIKKIDHTGAISGNGGFRLDIGSGATFNARGSYGVGYTDVNSGTLNLADVSNATANVGGLSSSGSGVVTVGSKDLVVNFNNDKLAYNGKIVGDGEGAKIYKNGSGEWTLNLTNDSKVQSVDVNGGAFSLGSNHFDSGIYTSNDFAINLGANGTLKHSTDTGETLTLNNLNASKGGAIVVGAKDEIVLTDKNTSTAIAANLVGDGWLYLNNVTDEDGNVKAWSLSGNNSNWSGSIAAYDPYAQIALDSANAASAKSAINFGSFGVLDVNQSTNLGSLAFDDNLTIDAASGKTLTLGNLSSAAHMLDDSVLTINGGGTVALLDGAAKNYYGATAVTGGSTLNLLGDNTPEGAARRTLTLADGVLAMDYTGVHSTEPMNSYWGSEIDVDGKGTIVVAGNPTSGKVVMNENIGFVGANPGTLVFNTKNSLVELASTIDGSGTLDKIGSGTLVLNGAGTFDAAIVDQGTLRLGTGADNYNDQLRYASLTVKNGVADGWTNALGSVSLKQNGALHLYNTDTVSLTGSGSVFSMDGGTLYVDVIDKDNYTNFKAEDDKATAQMNGGTIFVDTDKHDVKLSVGDSLTIVDVNAGNLSANPSNFTIHDNYAGMRFVVDRSKISDGYFNLLLKRASFAELAKTDNQKSVGSYLDAWQDGPKWDSAYNDMFAALENEAEKNPGVLDQLTGELRFSAMNAQIQSRNLMRQALTRNVLPSPTLTGCHGVNGVYSSAIRGQSWDYGQDATGLAGWASMFGASGEAEAHYGTSGYDYKFIGGMFGVELGSTATNQFGFYYSYNNTDVDGGHMGDVSVSDNVFGLYLRVSDDWGYTFANGTLGVAEYDIDRSLTVNRSVNYFSGKTDGWSGSVALERGVNFCLPASTFQPYGSLQYTHLRMDGYTESGTYNAFALTTNDTEYNSLQGVIGARWLKSIPLAASAFDFSAYVNWTHEFLDESVEGDLTMIAGPNNTFHIVGNGAGRDWIYAGLGGDWMLSNNFDIFGGADVQTNDYTTYVNGNGGFRIKW